MLKRYWQLTACGTSVNGSYMHIDPSWTIAFPYAYILCVQKNMRTSKSYRLVELFVHGSCVVVIGHLQKVRAAQVNKERTLLGSSFYILSKVNMDLKAKKMIEEDASPLRCNIFIWMVTHRRCWTTYRLEKRDLQNPSHCLLCDQPDETIDHILVNCIFSRQIW